MLLLSLNVALFLTAFLYLRWYSLIAAKSTARFKLRFDTIAEFYQDKLRIVAGKPIEHVECLWWQTGSSLICTALTGSRYAFACAALQTKMKFAHCILCVKIPWLDQDKLRTANGSNQERVLFVRAGQFHCGGRDVGGAWDHRPRESRRRRARYTRTKRRVAMLHDVYSAGVVLWLC